VDTPDLALKSYEGLQESAEQEIKTVTHDNEIYQSASSFEELGLSPELLQVGGRAPAGGWVRRAWRCAHGAEAHPEGEQKGSCSQATAGPPARLAAAARIAAACALHR
jgi:hypothetical protein